MSESKVDEIILFSEKQQFRQWWLLAVLVFANAMAIGLVVTQRAGEHDAGANSGSELVSWVGAGITLLVTAFILMLKLEMQIKPGGIFVRYFPFHLTFRQYPWTNISRAYVRRYSAFLEYGGWGFRFSLTGKGTAFNVSGNKGVQIEYSDGRKLLIGTRKPEELSQVLKKLNQGI